MRVSRVLAATLTAFAALGPAWAEPAPSPAPINATVGIATPAPAVAVAEPDVSARDAVNPPPAAPTTVAPAGTAPAGEAASGAADPSGTASPSTPTTGDAATEAAAAAPIEPPPPPEPTLVIDINLSTQRMNVSENGVGKFTWAISSAAAGYRTPTGTFKPAWMSRMWYSRQYDYSPMPHSIFFHNGVAIHATQAIRQLGSPASHGCVRLAPRNASTLYKLVGQHGKGMTRIVVHGTPRYRATVAYRGGSNAWRYASGARRRPPGTYGYYAAPASYYVPAPKRRAYGTYYSPAKPPRYVSRGLYQSPY